MKGKVYYKTECGKLIIHYRDNDIYVHKNNIVDDDKRISKELFDTYKPIKIKKDVYYRMMNEWFKNIHDNWTYKGHEFMSLDNFESGDNPYSTNYKLGEDVPYHDINKIGDNYHQLKNLILVYYQGDVYYHTVSFNSEKVGFLIDIKTQKIVRWCQLKHCAPVFDKTIKKII